MRRERTFLIPAIVLECRAVTTSRTPRFLLLALAISLPPFAAAAETLVLTSGEVVEGTLTAVADNIFSVSQPNGETRKIPRAEILRIEVQKSPQEHGPTAEIPKNFLNALVKEPSKFETPVQTFQTWRKAAMAGDIDGMVGCYASFRRDDVRRDLKKLPKEQREQRRKPTAMTEFTSAEPLYQGDRAALEVTWRIGLQSDSQVLQFALEKTDWKLIQ
jgi:hypothetical protein